MAPRKSIATSGRGATTGRPSTAVARPGGREHSTALSPARRRIIGPSVDWPGREWAEVEATAVVEALDGGAASALQRRVATALLVRFNERREGRDDHPTASRRRFAPVLPWDVYIYASGPMSALSAD